MMLAQKKQRPGVLASKEIHKYRTVFGDQGATSKLELVLTALNHALRSRNIYDGQLVHHSDKGCQYTALRFTQRLHDAGIAPSTGSVSSGVNSQRRISSSFIPPSASTVKVPLSS